MTLAFLRMFFVLMLLPLLGSFLLASASLIVGSFAADPFPEAFLFSAAGLGGFLIMLAMVSGTAWLDGHLDRRPFSFAPGWVATQVVHPARQLLLPAVGSVALYGYAAVLFWIPSNVENDPAQTFSWPVVWGIAAVASTVLMRRLETMLPR